MFLEAARKNTIFYRHTEGEIVPGERVPYRANLIANHAQERAEMIGRIMRSVAGQDPRPTGSTAGSRRTRLGSRVCGRSKLGPWVLLLFDTRLGLRDEEWTLAIVEQAWSGEGMDELRVLAPGAWARLTRVLIANRGQAGFRHGPQIGHVRY